KWADGDWDAFVAASGCRLGNIVSPGEPLPWAAARPILEQLARELADATTDESLPEILTPEQVWVQSDGRVQLLDGQFVPVESAHRLTLVALLRHAAVQLLEARPGGETASKVRAPVPIHASPMLGRLMSRKNGDFAATEFVADLEKTRGLPSEVAFRLKSGYLGLLVVLLSFGLISMFMSGLVGKALNAMSQYEQARRALETGNKLEEKRAAYIAARDSLGWRARVLMLGDPPTNAKTKAGAGNQTLLRMIADHIEIARDQGPDVQVRVVSAAISAPMIFWPLAWTVWAFLFRGGIAMRMMRLRLVRGDGRRASGLRCAVRTAALWLPISLLLLTVNALHLRAGVWSEI